MFTTLKNKIHLHKKINFKNWEINISIIVIVLEILKLDLKKLVTKFEKLKPLAGRGEVKEIKKESKKFYLIDESYNSSPDALITAIENLNEVRFKANQKVLVIGDMLELGKFSEVMHKKIIPTIIKVKPRVVITVGKFSKVISDNLPKISRLFILKKLFMCTINLSKKLMTMT